MNHSIYTADRATHLKIVMVALLAVSVLGVLGPPLHSDSKAVLKAGKPLVVSSTTTSLVR